LTDQNFDCCLDVSGVLKTLAVMVVAAGAAVRSRRERKWLIDRVSCVLRRIFSLLTLVLSLVGPFYGPTPVLHGYSFCGFLGAVIPHLSSRNCSKAARSLSSVSLGIPDGGVHPPNPGSAGAAYSAHR
jgi:hypothetical protein